MAAAMEGVGAMGAVVATAAMLGAWAVVIGEETIGGGPVVRQYRCEASRTGPPSERLRTGSRRPRIRWRLSSTWAGMGGLQDPRMLSSRRLGTPGGWFKSYTRKTWALAISSVSTTKWTKIKSSLFCLLATILAIVCLGQD